MNTDSFSRLAHLVSADTFRAAYHTDVSGKPESRRLELYESRVVNSTKAHPSAILRHVGRRKQLLLLAHDLAVIGADSMLDVVTMYRLCLLLPVHARLMLCGDTNQLMPVGPGLILHCLADHPEVASIRLGKSNRFGGAIAAAATKILAGVVPTLEENEAAPVADEIVRLYKTNPLDTQILCSRKGGPAGAKRINAQLQEISEGPSLMVYDDLRQCSISSGFKLDDPIICTKNRWAQGLTNGSMGRIVEVCNVPQLLMVENDRQIVVLGFVMWDDGQRRPLTTGLLDDIELAYVITVHKSQGSQWKRVILVVESNRLMDRTLVYTGITHAESSVLLIGDHTAFKRAVLAPPKASERQVGLPEILNSQLTALRQHLNRNCSAVEWRHFIPEAEWASKGFSDELIKRPASCPLGSPPVS
jgi:exodeoxyribonuclease V alpha subunit